MGLELGWGKVVEGGVFAVGIVVSFDEGEEFGAGVGGGEEAAILEHFGLELVFLLFLNLVVLPGFLNLFFECSNWIVTDINFQ